ncbi:MAG: LysR family transcriptional regulator [Acidimicrobiales bacterium]|nr:LysR family transcriptional regulator [Acidimicrobiales bacterium]
MDLRQLSALTAVADHRSFSAAARALHTVQSNISTHIANLERELDTELVDRSTGKLTEAGNAVVERARRIQSELESMSSDVASTKGEIAGVVRVGIIGTTGRWLAPRLLHAMSETHPRVRTVIVDATTTSLLPQLASSRLDIAVVNLPTNDPDVDTEPLFEEEHVVLVTSDNPLSDKDEIHLADLADVALLLEPVGTGFRDDLDADAARAGIELVAKAEVDGMRLLASLAYEGFGAAILPASAVLGWTDTKWRTISLRGTSPRVVGLATPRRGRTSAAARATANVLREVIGEEVPRRERLHLPATLH